MKKAIILSFVLALCLVGFAGYAADAKDAKDAKKGCPDKDAIQKVLEQWATAAAAGDLDKAMAFYSDKFSSSEYGDKDGLKKFLVDAKDTGYLADMKLDTKAAKITVDKDKATVTPVECKASFGSATIDLEFAKEGGKWVIKGMDVQQM